MPSGVPLSEEDINNFLKIDSLPISLEEKAERLGIDKSYIKHRRRSLKNRNLTCKRYNDILNFRKKIDRVMMSLEKGVTDLESLSMILEMPKSIAKVRLWQVGITKEVRDEYRKNKSK